MPLMLIQSCPSSDRQAYFDQSSHNDWLRFTHKAGTQGIHSDALGDAEVKATRENLGWEYEPL